MSESGLVPKRRFKGFFGDWEEKKLGQIADVNPSSTLPDVFEYVDLESVIGTTLISHRTEYKLFSPSRARRLAKSGDIFYQTVRPYQKNNFLFNLQYDNYVFSTGYAQIRTFINEYFLFTKLQEDLFVRIVLDRCTGTSYPAVSPNELSEIKISIPACELEQTKIGDFFKQLDNLISLHQKKLDKLKVTKQAYLCEMFPANGESVPKRRFKGFSGDWEEKELKDICSIKTGYAFDSRYYSDNGNYLVITNSNIQNNSVYVDNLIGNKIDIVDKTIINEYALIIGDILVTMDGTVGRIAKVNNNNQVLAQRVGRLIPHVNREFVYCSLDTGRFFYEMSMVSHGGTIKHISLTEIGVYKLIAPVSDVEQTRIGDFFNQLDNQISLQQRKLEKLKDIKKAYLNEMFV